MLKDFRVALSGNDVLVCELSLMDGSQVVFESDSISEVLNQVEDWSSKTGVDLTDSWNDIVVALEEEEYVA